MADNALAELCHLLTLNKSGRMNRSRNSVASWRSSGSERDSGDLRALLRSNVARLVEWWLQGEAIFLQRLAETPTRHDEVEVELVDAAVLEKSEPETLRLIMDYWQYLRIGRAESGCAPQFETAVWRNPHHLQFMVQFEHSADTHFAGPHRRVVDLHLAYGNDAAARENFLRLSAMLMHEEPFLPRMRDCMRLATSFNGVSMFSIETEEVTPAATIDFEGERLAANFTDRVMFLRVFQCLHMALQFLHDIGECVMGVVTPMNIGFTADNRVVIYGFQYAEALSPDKRSTQSTVIMDEWSCQFFSAHLLGCNLRSRYGDHYSACTTWLGLLTGTLPRFTRQELVTPFDAHEVYCKLHWCYTALMEAANTAAEEHDARYMMVNVFECLKHMIRWDCVPPNCSIQSCPCKDRDAPFAFSDMAVPSEASASTEGS